LHISIEYSRALILVRFETNSVVGLYFGRRWEIAYTICIVLFIFSGLWAYATVFANSMMTFVPISGLSAGIRPTSSNSTLATVRLIESPANAHLVDALWHIIFKAIECPS
jgi:hypothetical protein